MLTGQSIKVMVIAAAGGFLAGLAALPVALRLDWFGTAALLGHLDERAPATRVEERIITVPKSDYFGEAIEKVNDSIVAVQAFQRGALLRSASGLALTEDGLIATLNSAVPPQAEAVQVGIGGQLQKAVVVFREEKKNLAILAVSGLRLRASQFKASPPRLGDSVLAYARQQQPGTDTPYIATGLISQVLPRAEFKISVSYDSGLFGAAVLDAGGNILAMLDFRQSQPRPILARTISEALTAYWRSVKK